MWSGVCVRSDFIPMAWKDRGGHPASAWLALLVILLNSFCHCNALTLTSSSKSSTVVAPNTNNGNEEPSRPTGDMRYGRLILGRNIQPNKEGLDTVEHTVPKVKFSNGSSDDDYQSDMNWGWNESERTEREADGLASSNRAAVERLLKMEPRVECVGDSMKLKVHDTGSKPGSLFFVNRGMLQSPLPLSNLPQSCGHSLQGTPRDWIFRAPYDGCYVTRENDYYIFPLLWLGLPLKMSCPAEKPSNANPPTVSCYPEGMVVKIHDTSAKELQVKFKEQWQSLMRVSSHCGYSVVTHPDGLVISACYEPCVEPMDGMFTLELAGREGEIKLSCPYLPVSDVEPTDPQPLPCLSETSNKPCLTTPTPGKVYQKPKHPSKVVDPGLPTEPKLIPHPVPPTPVQPSLPPKKQATQHPFYPKPAEKPHSVTLSPWKPQHYFPFHPHPAKPVTPPPEDRSLGTEEPLVPWYPDHVYPWPGKPVTPPPEDPILGTEEPLVPWYPDHVYPRPGKPFTPPLEDDVPEKPQVPWYPDHYHPQPGKPVTPPPEDKVPEKPQVPWYPDHYYPQPRKPVTPPPEDKVPEKPQVPWYPDHYYPQPRKPVTPPPEDKVPEKPQVPWYPDHYYPQPRKPETPPPEDKVPEKPQVPWYPDHYHPQPGTPVTPPLEDDVPEKPQVPWYPDHYHSQPRRPVTPPPEDNVPEKPQVPWYPDHYYPQPRKPVTPPPEDKVPEKPQVPLYPDHYHPQPRKPVTPPPEDKVPKKPQVPLYPDQYHPQPGKPVSPPPEDKVPEKPQVPWYPDHYYPQPGTPVTPPPEDKVPEKPQVPWYPDHYYPQPRKPVTPPPEDNVPEKPQVPWYPDHFHPQPGKPVTQPFEDHNPEKPHLPRHATHPHFTPVPTPAVDPPPANKIIPPTEVPLGYVKPPHYPVLETSPTTRLQPPRPVDCPTICPTGFLNCCPANQPHLTNVPYPPRPADCPTICPTGFSNCCPAPISFHHHHHNHFGPAISKDNGIVPIYPFKQLSDLLKYTSVPVPGPTPTTITPLTGTDQTIDPTKSSLSFHDFWIRHRLGFPAASDPNDLVPYSDLKKPTELEAPADSALQVQPYNTQQSIHRYNLNNHPNGQTPSSSSNKPTEKQPQIQPYLPYNTQRFMHLYNPQRLMYPDHMPYSSQQSHRKAFPTPNKPSESQVFSSDPNRHLKPQPPKQQHFRPPPQDDPGMLYTSEPLEPDHQTSQSESPLQRRGKPNNAQEQPHGKPKPPKLVQELGGSHPSNSESLTNLQQPVSSDPQMPSYVSSLPIYYAGSKPFYPRKSPAKPPLELSRHDVPESLTHYWNPIMPLPANQKLNAFTPSQPTGSQDRAANQLNANVNRPINANNGAGHQKRSTS
uniref:ZP domain-containing protein n=1 Tax=Esox lucius TaxID=8010 RepID=A0AAY5L4T7_ESOLU